MIGKIFRAFSNDWKKCFQWLENFSGGRIFGQDLQDGQDCFEKEILGHKRTERRKRGERETDGVLLLSKPYSPRPLKKEQPRDFFAPQEAVGCNNLDNAQHISRKELHMLAEYKTKTNIYVLVGIVLQVAGRIVMAKTATPEWGGVMLLAGIVFFVMGCCCYAKAKGRATAWGLLGLFSIIGLLILVGMEDKYKLPKGTSKTFRGLTQ